MKTIFLTQGKVALVDDEDYERISKFKWCAHKQILKNRTIWYAERHVKTEGVRSIHAKMHREIFGITDPKIKLDHKNSDGLDNRKENLRIATTAQNKANSYKHPGTSSRFKGVLWKKDRCRWISTIRVKGKDFYLGSFRSEEDAAKAYNSAAIFHFGEFARINEL